MAPVIKELQRRQDRFFCRIAVSAQHRHMLDQALDIFDIKPDIDLNIMRPDQDLIELSRALMAGITKVLKDEAPDLVLVQGDTTTAMVAALSAFYQRIPVGHIEAGMRSFNRRNPFPEEINRRLIGSLASLHFAPTPRAEENLIGEGVSASEIFMTGNPVVDALMMILADKEEPVPLPFALSGGNLVMVTAHRRESWGPPIEDICRAILMMIDGNESLEVVFPVHLNPRVRRPVERALGGRERIHLIEPLNYREFVHLMNASDLILTDSGGVQEEALSMGTPLLVLREVTERPETLESGIARMTGTDPEKIASAAAELLALAAVDDLDRNIENPFGDGRAAERIVDILDRFHDGLPSSGAREAEQIEALIK